METFLCDIHNKMLQNVKKIIFKQFRFFKSFTKLKYLELIELNVLTRSVKFKSSQHTATTRPLSAHRSEGHSLNEVPDVVYTSCLIQKCTPGIAF